ncbi:FAD-dependent oxidoreductase, partial [Buchnera aphidicola]|nr:FAD-dependent oxidoreductase [Buchnera aphidicola]
IIATGSYPTSIPAIPFDNNKIWNSTDALLLNNIPDSLLIIGGGIIGIEMATIYSALGSKVDVIDRFTQF